MREALTAAPLLADVVARELSAWPGHPALAVADADGVRGAHDTGRLYPLASVTKLLSALTILDAVSESVLALDDPAGPPGSTLRHLLAHASGYSFREAVAQAPPGSRRIYSNAGIEAAARLLSDRTGMPFAAELQRRVLDPLGMRDTALEGSPARGGVAPLADLARLSSELLVPRVLGDAVVNALTVVDFAGLGGFLPGFGRHADNRWGRGAEIRGEKSPHWTSPHNDPATFGHFGISGSFVWVDRSAGLACCALSDRPFDSWAVEAWPRTSTAVLTAYSPASIHSETPDPFERHP